MPTTRIRCGALALATAAVLTLSVGCGGDGAEGSGGPGGTVQTFYGHLNAGRYDEALALYDDDTRAVLTDPNATGDEGFAGWAKQATRDGSVSGVTIVSETPQDDGRVRVEYDVKYGDGSTSRHTVTLGEAGGGWRMGFIG